ncbi:MAG: hypothetical protein LBF19_00850 [Prevotellaceae bacterium]|nr:hypothetical protein [Prevotellaceae bacterium]
MKCEPFHPRQRGTAVRRNLTGEACVALPRWRGCRQAGVDFSTFDFSTFDFSTFDFSTFN